MRLINLYDSDKMFDIDSAKIFYENDKEVMYVTRKGNYILKVKYGSTIGQYIKISKNEAERKFADILLNEV